VSPARLARAAAGLLFWVLAIGGTLRVLSRKPLDAPTSTLRAVWDHLRRQELEFEVWFPYPVTLELGDGVLLETGGGDPPDPWHPIGEVSALLDAEGRTLPDEKNVVPAVRVRIFDHGWPGLRDDVTARYFQVPRDAAAWVWSQLADEEKTAEIARILEAALRPHREEILRRLSELLQNFALDCGKVLESEARGFVQRHRGDIDRLAEAVEKELGRERLLKAFDEEVWPNLRRRLEPVLSRIGDEIWEKLPLWGLTWRLVYQTLPLTENDHFEKRWNEFLNGQVLPILRSHAGEFVDVSRQIAADTLNSPNVGPVLRETVQHVLNDPHFHSLLRSFFAEVFFENPLFGEALRARLRSPEAQALAGIVLPQLELATRAVGDLLLGTREAGITLAFAHVLRTQVLDKGSRHIWVRPGSPERPLLRPDAKVQAGIAGGEEAR
jgi:hypothetical protein